MASNSLLECLVYGWSAAKISIVEDRHDPPCPALPAWDESRVDDADERVILQHNWHELRLFMWDYVGIVRTTKRLERALRRITLLQQEIDEYYANFRVSNNLLELRNLVQVAELIVRCAWNVRKAAACTIRWIIRISCLNPAQRFCRHALT
jgi:L-aspartate oxidase